MALFLILILGLVFFGYFPSFRADFQFDDLESIVNNSYIKITSLDFKSLARAGIQDQLHNRPLGNLSFALNFYFGGLERFGYHLVNFFLLLLSGLGAGLLFYELLRQFDQEKKSSVFAGLILALLWLVHPLNTQAITYIVQRHTALAGGFFLWSIYFYHIARTRSRYKWIFYFLAGFSGFLSLLSKESALVLPLMLFVYKILVFDRGAVSFRSNLKWLIFLFGFYFLGAVLVFRGEMLSKWLEDFQSLGISPLERFLSQPIILLWYLFLILFPFPQFLSLEHQFFLFDSVGGYIFMILGFLIVGGIVALAVRWRKRFPLASLAIFWYLGSLLVEALPLPISLASEHRLYLASLSVLGAGVGFLIFKSQLSSRVLIAFFVLIALFWAGFTYQRNLVWESRERLWKDTVSKAPGLARPWNNYCSALVERRKCFRAERICATTLVLFPDSAPAYTGLGVCLAEQNQIQQAKEMFRQAIRKMPDYAPANFNLGLLLLREGDVSQAEAYFQKAMKAGNINCWYFYWLGVAEIKQGNKEKAIETFKKALELEPRSQRLADKIGQILGEEKFCSELKGFSRQFPFLKMVFESWWLRACRG